MCSFLDLLESNTLSLDAARMLFHVERSALELVPEIQRIHENVTERSVQLAPNPRMAPGRNVEVDSGNVESMTSNPKTLVKT